MWKNKTKSKKKIENKSQNKLKLLQTFSQKMMSSIMNKPLTILYVNAESGHNDTIDYKEKHLYYSGNKSNINDVYFTKGMKCIIICRFKKKSYTLLGIGEIKSQTIERISKNKNNTGFVIPQWKIDYTDDNEEIKEFNEYLQNHLSHKKLQNKQRGYLKKDDIYDHFQNKYGLTPFKTNKRLNGIVPMVQFYGTVLW